MLTNVLFNFSCACFLTLPLHCSSSPNSAGYLPAQNDQFSWTLSFPTATSFQVCLFRLVTPMAWSDATLKFKWSYATTSTVCAAGQYIDAAFQCQACPAGSYGGASPQSSPACSGPCSAGMRRLWGLDGNFSH